VGRGRDFTVEEPVKCHLEKLIDGVRLVGKHDGDVTDLSISQWMSTRLASGSKDGTVCTICPTCPLRLKNCFYVHLNPFFPLTD
jgi:hypothetical protein